MSTGQPKQPKQPRERVEQASIIPQNIHLTDAEDAALDEIWAQIAAEDPDAIDSLRQDGEGETGEGQRQPGH